MNHVILNKSSYIMHVHWSKHATLVCFPDPNFEPPSNKDKNSPVNVSLFPQDLIQ